MGWRGAAKGLRKLRNLMNEQKASKGIQEEHILSEVRALSPSIYFCLGFTSPCTFTFISTGNLV